MSLVIILSFIIGTLVVAIIVISRRNRSSENLGVLNERLENLAENVKGLTQDVGSRLKEQRESVERSTLAVHKQVQGFTTGVTSLAEQVKQVQDSVKNVSTFQEIFRAPKLRGIWGEMSLEASLSQYFSRESYKLQHYFKSGEAVDAVVKLPNNLLLPIDSKFSWENFERMVNASADEERMSYQKTFFTDVKKKIDEIASKYVLPSEGTVDFALMYMPAETIYYEVINNIRDFNIPSYAGKKKVMLVSPNTFALSISAIKHWFKDVQLSRQTQEIMKRLERIAIDGRKLGEDFRKLGSHLNNAQGSYDGSERRLTLMVDRVQNIIEVEGEEEHNLLDTKK